MERIKDYKKLKEEAIEWLRKWFDENGKGCNAIVGLSGGKDSTIVAKLCAEALGPDRVIGVSMPDENQDENNAKEIAEDFGIHYMVMPIDKITKQFKDVSYFYLKDKVSVQSIQNLPPRVRMTMLYFIAQNYNGRVIGTCNASENYIGYFTKFGDGASDCEPLGRLTVTEVKKLGHELGIRNEWVERTPDDGLPESKPDEEKFGFTYEMLDKYICDYNTNEVPDEIKEKIDKMHDRSLFKTKVTDSIDTFFPEDIMEFEFGPLDSYQEFIEDIDDYIAREFPRF